MANQQQQMNQMMKQVQKMQADMAAAQDALTTQTVEGSAGGGMVKVVVTGAGEVQSVAIHPDVVDPDDVEMLEDLVLAAVSDGLRRAQELIPRIDDAYKRTYYAGIVYERRAKAQLHRVLPGAAAIAADWYRKAMEFYEKAEKIRPPGNDESILRWNTCVRMLEKHEPARATRDDYEPALDD